MKKNTRAFAIWLSWLLFITGCLYFGLSSCTITTKVIPNPKQVNVVSPYVEQAVREYTESARVINAERRGGEIIYTIGVKEKALKANDLINLKK